MLRVQVIFFYEMVHTRILVINYDFTSFQLNLVKKNRNKITCIFFRIYFLCDLLLTLNHYIFQIDWMNRYHEKVLGVIGPLIANDSLTTAWLRARTQTIIINSSDNVKCSITVMLLSISVMFLSS